MQSKKSISKRFGEDVIQQVYDISEEVCSLLEQCSLFLGKKELPLTDKNGTLVVLQEILASKQKQYKNQVGFGIFNKLIIIDNRMKGRLYVKNFGKKGTLKELAKFTLSDIRVAFPKPFLIHLLLSNRLIKSLFNNIFK